MAEEKKDDLVEVGKTEVEPLSDEDLESASGGLAAVDVVNNVRTGCPVSNTSTSCC